jgi:hypothetical protein
MPISSWAIIFIGILFVSRPLGSAEAVTLVMSFFFLAGGLYQVVASRCFPVTGFGLAIV